MKRLIGIFTLCLSLLTISIVVMLVKISLYVNSLRPEYSTDIAKYIPIPIYFLIGIPIIISISLIFSNSQEIN